MIIIYILMFLIGMYGATMSLINISKGLKRTLNSFLTVLNIALMIYWAIHIYILL